MSCRYNQWRKIYSVASIKGSHSVTDRQTDTQVIPGRWSKPLQDVTDRSCTVQQVHTDWLCRVQLWLWCQLQSQWSQLINHKFLLLILRVVHSVVVGVLLLRQQWTLRRGVRRIGHSRCLRCISCSDVSRWRCDFAVLGTLHFNHLRHHTWRYSTRPTYRREIK